MRSELGKQFIASCCRRERRAWTAQLGPEIGCRGLLVHAEASQVRDFYLHLIPEFERSPTDDFHLVLLLKDILRTLRA